MGSLVRSRNGLSYMSSFDHSSYMCIYLYMERKIHIHSYIWNKRSIPAYTYKDKLSNILYMHADTHSYEPFQSTTCP